MQSVKGDRLDSAAAFVCIFSRLLVFARLIRPLKWGFLQILARIALIASVLGLAAVSANSFELPTTPAGSWTASGTITTGTGGGGSFPLASGTYFKTTPSGLRMTVTVDGVFSGGVPSGTSGSYFANPANTNTTSLNPSAAGTNPGPFTTNPVLPASTNGIVLETEFNPCTVSGPTSTTCTGLGTVTVTFTDPLGNPVRVVNPKIHVTRFGGTVGSMELTTGLQLNAALSTPGLTLGPTSPAAQTATLNTTLSNEFFGDVAAPGVNTNVNCNATATSSAGCGSIQVTGSPSTMVFNVKGYRTTIPPNSWSNGGDAYMFDVTFDEDFGGAPNTYEGGGTAAAHLISDLKLGGAVTAENVTTSNGDGTGAGLITVDPNAVVAPAAPGDTNDGVASFPALLTSNIGSTYTVTPTISGASRAGKICGWLDFDRSGTFSAAEGVCNTFASGATSAPLTWTVPTATTAGPTYARVRVTYDTNMSTASFNGLFSSGEVEDYLVQIKPAVKVVKALVPAADTGTFNLQIGGTTFATAVGNNGTTGFKSVYHTDTPDVTVATNVSTAPVTGVAIAETAAGATVLANYATTSACTNAAGTAVTVGGTASAPTVTIPQSVTGASANGQAQTITCTLTNSKKPIVTVTKISNGGVGTFNFSGTNGIGAHAITTATSGVGVSGTPQVLTNLGTVTRITETVPTGFSLTNIACTGTGAGNTTNNLAGGFVDLAVGAIVAGANINCTFTNTAWPKLTLTKTVVTTGGGVATVANFPLTATGPVTITGTSGAPAITSATVNPGVYALSETPLADYTAGAWSCTGGTLAGSNLTLAAGDVASCSITNTFVPNPKLTVAKTAGTPTTALGAVTTATDALDTITFTYVVNNTGNVPMTNVVPVDAGPKFNGIAGTNALGAFSPASATIAVGGSQAFTATYVLSQTDVNNAAGITGGVTNSATVTGKDPSGGTFTSPSSTASTTISKTSALTTAKTAGTPTTALGAIATATDAGDTITYTYAVTNTGNVSLTNVVPSDAGPKFNGIAGTGTLGAFSPASATIAPGVTQNFTAVYTLAQTDVNNAAGITNAVTNSATASGKQPDGTTTTSPAGTATATIGKTSTLTTSKSAGAPTVANGVQATLTDGGDKITYSYTVTNTGNVTLTNVVPADAGPKFNGITGTGSLGAFAPTSATLTPGGSVIFTATYTLSQADVNNAAGLTNAVTNSATSSGKQPDGTTTTSAAATATATIAKTASLTTLKSAASPTIALGAVTSATDALDTITFTYAVTNTGNVALSNVIPADAGPKFNGIAGTGTLGAFSPAATILQPGATQNFTAVYTLTQTDVNNAAGITNGVTNTATASGKQPDGSTTTSPSSSASTTINKTSSLSLSKSAAAPTVSAGASATVTDVGDSITYSYTVTNTGNVTLTNVVPSDAGPKFNGIAGTGTLGAYAPASATLAPGNSVIFTAVYPLTQTDINNGAGISSGVTNTASASGKQPDGTTTTSPSASATATILESSSLTLVKTAAAPTVAAGANATATDGLDTITFSYTVKNTGNVSLTNVTPVDSGPTFNGNAGTGSLGAFSPASASLAPGAQQIFTATYTLSQGDVNNAAGVTNGVANTATAKGTKPSGATTTSPSSTANATISKTSALTLVKTSSSPSLASGANAAITDAGDTITYSYTVNNTGNVTLFSVVPSDSGPTFNGSAAGATLSAYSPASATILPGASQVFTATYTLTQTDIDHAAGVTNGVTNSATASGTQPGGATTVSNSSTGQTTIPASSSLTLTKAAGVPTVALGTNPTQTGASDTITYTYTVKNTGNVTLTGVVPADTGPTFNGAAKAGTLGAFSPASATLAPGATQVFTAVYTLAQADMNSAAGITNGVSNTATASGLQPGGATTTTAPSTAKTTIPETSSLALTKAAGAPSVALGTVSTLTDGGDKITYTYTVRNTGNVTLTNVAPTDVGPSFNGTPGTGSLGAFSPASATLAPGASAIFTAVYTMSQGDVNNAAGITNGVTNTASAIGTKPSGSTVTAPNATAQATIAASSNLSLTKSAGVPTTNLGTLATKTDGGDTITYSYTVRNSGNVTLTGVKPVDAGPTFNGNAATGALGAFVPATATLAPGATQVFTATYTLSQSDVDNAAGVTNAVSNTATAVGTQPGGATTTSPSATAKATIGNGPALTVTKVADKASVSALPATITYTITLANTGNVTLSAVNLTDALTQGGALTLTSGPTLSSGDGNSNSKIDINETWTYTATYVLTQAEMNNGANIVNTATVSTAQTAAQTATATTTISQTSSMSLLKNVVSVTTSNGANATETDAADVITYSYLVTNTGNTTLTNVAPADPGPTFNGHAAGSSLSAFTPAPVSLAPGASQAFTATYILAQADVNNAAGITNGVSNTATTSGKKPDGSSIASPSSTATTTIANASAITLVKSGTLNTGPDGRADAGDTISYSFTIKNTGNTTLTNITVTDAVSGVTVSGGPITLAPGAQDATSITATYVLTQADIDAGTFANTATVNGKDPQNNTVSATNGTTVPLAKTPSLAIDKTTTSSSYSVVGDNIFYNYAITNTGNTTITSPISVSDNKIVTPNTVSCDPWPGAGLAPAAVYHCSATYVVTQADIDAGSVVNIASASDGTTTSPSDTVTVPAVKTPAISMVKTPVTVNFTVPGDTVSYDYVVTNTGNTTITTPVTVTDNFIPSVSCPTAVSIPPWPAAGLLPGASVTCHGSYTVTQDDLDIGSVVNIATATDGTISTPPASATVPANANPGITLVKTANDASFATLGQVVSYTYDIQNTGNVTLTKPIDITDDQIGTFNCFTGNLTPTSHVTCVHNYTITQADLDRGSVTNVAFGKTTYGVLVPPTPVTSPTATQTIPADPTVVPGLSLTKSSAPAIASVGQTITYTLTVKNTGKKTLSNVNITDPLIPSLSCTIASMLPGVSDSSCQGNYVVTQADFDAGHVVNTGHASAIDPQGNPVTADDTLVNPTPAAAPALQLTKTPSVATFDAPGQVIGYVFAVKNTGNVTLHNVVVTDPLIPSLSCTIASLAPGATNSTCSATYTTTLADVNAGSRNNTATAQGTDPFGTNVNTTGNASVPATQTPQLTLTKTGTLNAGPDGRADVGDTISYTFTVKNTGNVTLTNVSVSDPLVTVTGAAISLLPGATDTTTFTGIYVLTQADINAGVRPNTATTTGTLPDNVTTVSDAADATTPLPADPKLALTKTGTINDSNSSGVTDAGDTIIYVFTVKNTGNVTLTNVLVTDPLVTVSGAAIPSLAPGATDTTQFTATYVLTQADIDAGVRANTASVAGTPPTGPPVSASATETKTLPSTPDITIAKAGTLQDGGDGRADVGDTITYAFTVKNTGNVTLSNVTVSDPVVTVAGGPVLSLAPGATDSTTFTATYTLTQADIDAANVHNVATVKGTPPIGADVSNTGAADTPLPSNPAVSLIKNSVLNDGGDGRADAGDTITYAFTVTNTGNVTLTNLTVADPLVTVTGGPIASLAPGAVDSSTFTATYTLTQADVNAGQVLNTATAKGTPPTGADVTGPASKTTVLPADPALSIVKAGVLNAGVNGVADAGDTITYSFTVQNTGNVTLTAVTVTDPLVTVAGTAVTLLPGETSTGHFTGTYTLTQADVNAGQVPNTATVTGKPPVGPDVTSNGSATTPLPANPALTLAKTGTLHDGGDGIVNVGDTISYVLTVTNPGNVTLTNVKVADPLLPSLSSNPACTIASFAPGATDSGCTGTYTLTQADIDAGSVVNVATANGTPPTGPDLSAPATANTPLAATPAMTLTKAGTLNAGPDGHADAGDTITYAFTVKNTGNVTLTNVTVSDPVATVTGGPIATLAVGATDTTTFTAVHTLTQAEIDTGSFSNTATVAGNPPTGPPVTAPGSNTTPLGGVPGLQLTKSATVVTGPDGVADAGDVIAYSFTVKNTGNVTLSNVVITDPSATVSGGPLASLAPGVTDATTFTATHTLTQADIDSGSFANTAGALGNPPTGPPVTTTATATAPLSSAPAVLLTKTGTLVDGGDGIANAGDTVTYTFTVKNTGNVTLTNVTVTDPTATMTGGPIASLAPGASDTTTFTAHYTLTVADINAGQVSNTATADGTPPTGPHATNDDTAIVPLPSVPSISLLKTGTLNDGGDGMANAGDTVTYAFTVSNTGNVTLTDVAITDPKVTVTGGPLASLAPGATDTTTFTATYTLTAADVNSGAIVNTASVAGTPPTGADVTAPSTSNIPLAAHPSLALVKTGVLDPGPDGRADAGDVINYAFTVTNTGNVTLTNVTLADPGAVISGGPIASLAGGASDTTTFTASHILTAAEVAAGTYANTATVNGTPPTGPDVSAPGSTSVALPAAPAITLVKAGTLNDGGDGVANIGDTITYAFTVTNTGNVPLTGITVSDPLIGAVSGGPITLAAGAVDTATFTATYTVTAADVDAGTVNNTATVKGTPPTGADVTGPGSTSTPLAAAPAMTLAKSGTLNDGGDGVANVGDTITYAFTVKNTGNVTLSNVTVTDPKVTVTGGPITLAAGATDATTFTAVYTLTAADIDAGTFDNTATVTGKPPSGPDVSATGNATTPLSAAPAMTLAKAGTLNDGGDGVANAGDTITYAFTVANTGNVTLTNVTVTDAKVTVSGGPIASLPAGASDNTTFTATYTLTAADIDAGKVDNSALVTGTPPSGPNVTAPGITSTLLPAAPAITLTKTGTLNDGGDGAANAGDTITYAFTVANTGNVTLTNVTVTDPKVTVSGGPIASLAAGASNAATFTATYTLTAADIDAGKVDNTALVKGTPPTGADVTSPGATSTPLAAAPALQLTKTGTVNTGPDGVANAGDTITYAFTVTNTGNVTLTNVSVSDPKVTVSGGPIASLAAGASDAATFTATYTLTAADIDAGHVPNTATVSGTPPTGPAVTAPGATDTAIAPSPALTLAKVGTLNLGPDGVANAGDTITYAFTVQNTGNVTLTNVTVSDPLVTVAGGPIASLAAGATDATTFTATYTLTAADVNAGKVDNSATVKGTPPTGADVTAPGATSTPIVQVPSVALVKNGTVNDGGDGIVNVGDTITYAFTVTNTGNVDLTNVTVTDPLVTVAGGPVTLAAGASDTASFTATYTLTTADVDAGKVDNTAFASGTPPTGAAVTSPGTTSTPLAESPAMTLAKAGTLNDGGDGVANVGDTITYAFTVKNTGNVTLSNIAVTDPKVTVAGGPLASLAVGATDATTFTATYTLTAADIDSGKVDNTASALGKSPAGTDVPATASATTPLPANAGIGLVKTATFNDENGDGYAQVGETIGYVFTVKNTGNVTLTNVTVTDPLVTVTGGPLATLAAGATDATTFKATKTIAASDITAGNVVNSASAAGTPPTGPVVSDTSDSSNPSDGTAPGSFGSGPGKDDPTTTPLLTKPIVAVNDTGSLADGSVATPNVLNVLTGDTLGGSPATVGTVTITVASGSSVPPQLTFDPLTGAVGVNAGTPPGLYSFDYTICETANPGNCSTATATVNVNPPAVISGVVFVDENSNGVFDSGEPKAASYGVRIVDAGGTVIGTAVTDATGAYSISVPPGVAYTVIFSLPGGGADVGSITTPVLTPGEFVADQNLPIDPSGIVYDSVTHLPVSGVTVELTDAAGNALPAACLGPGQQGQVTGASGAYRFDVLPGAAAQCPVGQTEYRLKVTNPAGYLPGFAATIPPQAGPLNVTTCPVDPTPGGSCQVSPSAAPPPVGSAGVYYSSFLIASGDGDLVNNHIAIQPVPALPASFSKKADVATAERGQIVTYTIEANNLAFNPARVIDTMPAGFNFVSGSATANGVAVVPIADGQKLTFDGLIPDPANTVVIKLKLVVGSNVQPGTSINNAQLINPATGNVIATARAAVEILPEHVFDCGDIIGKVFDDKNRNGYQDDGEQGLPGVRVATVKGLLITTDKNGRYHVGCADVPDQDIGSNFILKLDTRTLPTGYRLTTENPQTVRLTRGKVTKLNFGASITRVIRLDMTSRMFGGGSDVSPKLASVVKQLVGILDKEPSTLRLTYYTKGESADVARARLSAVQKLLEAQWSKKSGRYTLPIETRIVGVK